MILCNNLPGFKLLLFFIITKWSCVVSAQVNPKILFERNSTAKWKNLTLPLGDFNGPSFYSEEGETLHASCSAPYPITWKISGLIRPLSVLRILEPQRSFNPDRFTISLAFYKTEPSLISALISCRSIQFFTYSDQFGLFVKGIGNETLILPDKETISDAFLIPCQTTAPQESTSLFKLNDEEEVNVANVIYNPLEGFTLINYDFFDEGTYLCRQGSSQLKITVKRSPLNQTLWVNPKEDKLERFTNEEIILSCSADPGVAVELWFDIEAMINITFESNYDYEKVVIITPLDEELNIVKGRVTCTSDNISVKEWTFEFLKAPKLIFDDYFSQMYCITDLEEATVEVKSLRCLNDLDCRYLKRCLDGGEESSCSDQIVYQNKIRSQCRPFEDIGKNCVNLRYTSWNGIAQCKLIGLTKNWPYFTALDLHKYSDWKKVNEKDLLRLEKVGFGEFRCTGVGFIFANNLAFELELFDNSTELIQGNGGNGRVTVHEHPSSFKIQGFQVVSSLELFDPKNVKTIRCVTPFWNSTEVLKTPFYTMYCM